MGQQASGLSTPIHCADVKETGKLATRKDNLTQGRSESALLALPDRQRCTWWEPEPVTGAELTLKAHRLLPSCDALVYDSLVPPGLA